MSSLIKPERLRMLAQSHYEEHKATAKRLRKQKYRNLDDKVHEWDLELFEEIDCLDCGNCCRSLGPRIIDTDIRRLAKHLKMKDSEFISTYLRTDEDGDYVFKSMPCPFLMDDNFCMVYEKRPRACRDYPHTHQPKFQKRLNVSLKNTFTCPVVYHIFRRLSEEV
ncbi:YkgJ family cysteine cluster protein [Salinivirga cyanobacteriivorans]|uniref:Flagellin N-methylase n=1 Tax=Salinivirga cyanobacteriivorans TaxID=1307839 RepID=A0A0S2I1K5_9BACT|nr:YkgJ family cysteine cluster protein [Salinivirga cyanobacteriivorans]ALO16037.1 Flagellin N-methylase [Salinivirga cyanobacteriivorans]